MGAGQLLGWTPPSHLSGWLRPAFSLALTAVLVGALLSRSSIWAIVSLLRELSVPWAAAGLAGYLVANLLRAVRFQALLRIGDRSEAEGHAMPPASLAARSELQPVPGRAASTARPLPRYSILLPITFVHSMFNSLLGRAGEVSFLYLAKTRLGLPLGESTAVIVVTRVLDYVAVAALFLGATLAVPGRSLATRPEVILVLSTALLLAGGVLVLAPWLGGRTLAAASRWLDGYRIARWVLHAGQTLVRSLTLMRVGGVLVPTLLWSLLVWIVSFGWIYAFLTAVGVEIQPASFVVGSTFGILSKALPLVTPGGFGMHEAGWTMGFVLVGMDPSTAIASGFAVNILTLAASVAWGLPGLLWMQFRRAPR